MSLIDVISDLSGLTGELRSANLLLSRIADALDRAVPPVLPVVDLGEESTPHARSPLPLSSQPFAHTFAETPAEYEARVAADASLALALGDLPCSPKFQSDLARIQREMIEDLQRITVLEDNPVSDLLDLLDPFDPLDLARPTDTLAHAAPTEGEAGGSTNSRFLTRAEAAAIVRGAFEQAKADALAEASAGASDRV